MHKCSEYKDKFQPAVYGMKPILLMHKEVCVTNRSGKKTARKTQAILLQGQRRQTASIQLGEMRTCQLRIKYSGAITYTQSTVRYV